MEDKKDNNQTDDKSKNDTPVPSSPGPLDQKGLDEAVRDAEEVNAEAARKGTNYDTTPKEPVHSEPTGIRKHIGKILLAGLVAVIGYISWCDGYLTKKAEIEKTKSDFYTKCMESKGLKISEEGYRLAKEAYLDTANVDSLDCDAMIKALKLAEEEKARQKTKDKLLNNGNGKNKKYRAAVDDWMKFLRSKNGNFGVDVEGLDIHGDPWYSKMKTVNLTIDRNVIPEIAKQNPKYGEIKIAIKDSTGKVTGYRAPSAGEKDPYLENRIQMHQVAKNHIFQNPMEFGGKTITDSLGKIDEMQERLGYEKILRFKDH